MFRSCGFGIRAEDMITEVVSEFAAGKQERDGHSKADEKMKFTVVSLISP